MTEQTAKEYQEELKKELAELKSSQALNPSEYKENRIIELQQRLGITEENPDGRKFDDSIIISGPVRTTEIQPGIFPNSVGTTPESVSSETERASQASSEEQDGSENSSVAESNQVNEFAVTPNVVHTRHDAASAFEDTSEYINNSNYPQQALQFAVGALAVETAETDEEEYTIDELFIIIFAYVLGGWKAEISSTRSGDGLFVEVTHNNIKEETYVDIYKKQVNHIFSHHDH